MKHTDYDSTFSDNRPLTNSQIASNLRQKVSKFQSKSKSRTVYIPQYRLSILVTKNDSRSNEEIVAKYERHYKRKIDDVPNYGMTSISSGEISI